MRTMTTATVRAHLRVINGHYQLRCDQRLHLPQLKTLLPSGRLHTGRPTMLSCRILGKRVMFFPNGTIQVLAGNMTPSHFDRLQVVIRRLLTSYTTMNSVTPTVIHVSQWIVNNLVVYFDLRSSFVFSGMLCNGRISYEPELFPALLLSKKSTAHVTLFPNGKGIVTGVRSPTAAVEVLQDILLDLKHRLRHSC